MIHILDKIEIELMEKTDNSRVIYSVIHLTGRMGFSEAQQSLLASAASELSTNIIKYAGKGDIVIKSIRQRNRSGIEIIAYDEGPGIPDIDEAMKDHFTTGEGLGLGLPSVCRIMDEMKVYSLPGRGTVIAVRKWK